MVKRELSPSPHNNINSEMADIKENLRNISGGTYRDEPTVKAGDEYFRISSS